MIKDDDMGRCVICKQVDRLALMTYINEPGSYVGFCHHSCLEKRNG